MRVHLKPCALEAHMKPVAVRDASECLCCFVFNVGHHTEASERGQTQVGPRPARKPCCQVENIGQEGGTGAR